MFTVTTLRTMTSCSATGPGGNSWPPGQHPAELHELAVEGRVRGGRGEHQVEQRDGCLARGLGATHVAEPGARGAVVDLARADRCDERVAWQVVLAALSREHAHSGDLGDLGGYVDEGRPCLRGCTATVADRFAPGADDEVDVI